MNNAMDVSHLTEKIKKLEAENIKLRAEVFSLDRRKRILESVAFQAQKAAINLCKDLEGRN